MFNNNVKVFLYLAKHSTRMAKDQHTEDRILEAAQRVFTRSGLSGARTQDIADEAGVNRALINYYFRSRDNLAQAVFLRAAGSLLPALMKTLAGDASIEMKIRKVIDLEYAMLNKNPYLPLYVLAELQYHPDKLRKLLHEKLPINELRKAALQTLQGQLDEAAAEGRLRPTRAEDLLITLVSLIIFPFAASGMIDIMMGIAPEDQHAMRNRRREDLAGFILRGLEPDMSLKSNASS